MNDSQQEMDTGSDSQESIFASKSTLGGTRGLKARLCGHTGGGQGRSSLILGSFLESFWSLFCTSQGSGFRRFFGDALLTTFVRIWVAMGCQRPLKTTPKTDPNYVWPKHGKSLIWLVYTTFWRGPPPQKQQHSLEFSG